MVYIEVNLMVYKGKKNTNKEFIKVVFLNTFEMLQ